MVDNIKNNKYGDINIDYDHAKGERFHVVDAVAEGDKDRVKELLSGGFSVNEQNDSGVTPVIKAAERNDVDMVKILIKEGADISKKDFDGFSAEKWAQINNSKQLTEVLRRSQMEKEDSIGR